MKEFTFIQTNSELEEGYGSLFQREILAYLVSKYYKGLFFRSKLFFNKKNNPNFKITKKFNNLFNFIGKLRSNKNSDIKNITKTKQIKNLNKNSTYNISFKLSLNFFNNLKKKNNKNLILNLRKKFWYKRKKKDLNCKTIAIHIRNYRKIDGLVGAVGDRSIKYQFFNHDYNLPYYNKNFFTLWIESLVKLIIKKNRLKKNKFNIILCSTGPRNDFDILRKKLRTKALIISYIDKDDFNTFIKLINADYLILSHSSFSYIASFLCRGKKYIREGFRHPLPYDVNIIKDKVLLNLSYMQITYALLLKIMFIIKLKYNSLIKKINLTNLKTM
jgi:hypothetical protein